MGTDKVLVGRVAHFYDRISVAVVELERTLRAGDRVAIEGPQTNVEQRIVSMQIEHVPVTEARAGEAIGLKVANDVREGDLVYKLVAGKPQPATRAKAVKKPARVKAVKTARKKTKRTAPRKKTKQKRPRKPKSRKPARRKAKKKKR